MVIETLLQRVRSHLASPGVTKAGLAAAAGLHPNTLRDADSPDWNPKLETLKALEPHLPAPSRSEWPVASATKDGGDIPSETEEMGADSPGPFAMAPGEAGASLPISSRACPSSGGPATRDRSRSSTSPGSGVEAA